MKKWFNKARAWIDDIIYRVKSRRRFKKKLEEIRKRDPYIYK